MKHVESPMVPAESELADRERERLREIVDDIAGWRRWGPYVSDRAWGTVREDPACPKLSF